jgi:hypothetical protein
MLEQKNVKSLDSKFLLTAEQKIALFEAKVARAEAQVKSLADLAKKLKRYNLL